MSSTEKVNWLPPFFIIVILATVFGVMYYISTDSFQQKNQNLRKEFDYAGRPVNTPKKSDNIVIQRQKRTEFDRIALVFKDLENKEIYIDLYLLDLDPQQSFAKKYPIKTAKKEMSFGGKKYRLITVSDNYITLARVKK
jgi:hypothetical protein